MKKLFFAGFAAAVLLSFNACKKCEDICHNPCPDPVPVPKDTTIILQPGPGDGLDALIFGTHGCSPGAQYENVGNANWSNLDQLPIAAWTFNANSCSTGEYRDLLKFSGLNTIPANATILSAKLSLYGVSSSLSSPQGNSYYPGSPYASFGSNESLLQRVTGNWDEATVTWNTQPPATSQNEVVIPASTSQWNFNVTDLDITNLVKDIMANPSANYGFLLRMQTEQYYRSVAFASSDNANASLRPKLVVAYRK